MKLRTLRVLLAVAPALVAACGGGATDDLARATPSFDSLSMQFEKLDRNFQALETLLHSLKPADHFNVLLFNTATTAWSPAPVTVTAEQVEKARDASIEDSGWTIVRDRISELSPSPILSSM